MTIQYIQQQIGQLQRGANHIARRLELTDRIAETPLHPDQDDCREDAVLMRENLMRLYTRMHRLEARIPTRESLSEGAFRRLLTLGLGIEAAEHERMRVYRESKDLGFKAA